MEDMAWVLYALLSTQSFGLLMLLWRLNQARDYGEADRRFARLSLEELLAIRGLLEAQRRRSDMEAERKAINRGVYDGDIEE